MAARHGLRVMTMGILHSIAFVVALVAFTEQSLGWQERSIGGNPDKPVAANPGLELLGLKLDTPDLSSRKDAGTEIRIPGIGTIGVLPKFDLGFELLYGGNDAVARPEDKSQPSDVQLRATLKHRF